MKKTITRLGIFDSGVGGLSVLQELRDLPIPEIIYVADTANLPYGEKTPEQIITFTHRIINYFVHCNVDAVVIACHTASAIAAAQMRALFPHLLIFDVVEPVVQAAVATSKNKIGIIATPATIKSQIHRNKILSRNKLLDVVPQACPRLVPLIESGRANHQELRLALAEYLEPLQQQGCDTLIIGCTHYELIKDTISTLAPDMTLISAPGYIRQQLKNLLGPASAITPKISYQVTGDVEQFRSNAQSLMGWKLESVTALKIGLVEVQTEDREFESR